MKREDLSPVTVRRYVSDLEMFIAWLKQSRGTKVRLNQISTIELINYRQHLIAVKGLKPATVNRRLEALRRFCKWACNQKLIKRDIALELKAVRTVRSQRPIGLAEPEVHMLLRAAGQSRHGLAKRNYALIQLMLQAGLRVGEVAALSVADVRIRERSGIVRIRQGKGGKEREVPLNATARRALSIYQESRQKTGAEDFLFTTDACRVLFRSHGPASERSNRGKSGIRRDQETIELESPRGTGGFSRNAPVTVVCASRYRSSIAASLLESEGFERLVNVMGGMHVVGTQNVFGFPSWSWPKVR